MLKIKKLNGIVLGTVLLLSGCQALTGRETAGEYIDDTSITTKVKAAIIHDPKLKVLDIGVETYKGEVQLSGFVETSQEALKAENDARKVEGVRSVKNNLIVRQKSHRNWK